MPRRCAVSDRFQELVATQSGVIARSQAVACGWTPNAITHALTSGAWVRLLRAIYRVADGPPLRQRLTAALLWAGAGSALDGFTACRVHGLRQVPDDVRVYLASADGRQLSSHGFVVVRRSSAPLVVTSRQGLDVLAPPDAVVAAARRLNDVRMVRALVAEAVQRRVVTNEQLHEALERTPRHRIRLLDTVLHEIDAGVRSAPEAEFAALVATSRVLPGPLLNCRLYDAGGRWLADPDAYWPDAALVHETDSRESRCSAADWQATLRRHARMTAAGLLVIHSPPSRIRTDGARLLAQLESAYRAGLDRGPVAALRHEQVSGEMMASTIAPLTSQASRTQQGPSLSTR